MSVVRKKSRFLLILRNGIAYRTAATDRIAMRTIQRLTPVPSAAVLPLCSSASLRFALSGLSIEDIDRAVGLTG
jgi:hypothetical protein